MAKKEVQPLELEEEDVSKEDYPDKDKLSEKFLDEDEENDGVEDGTDNFDEAGAINVGDDL